MATNGCIHTQQSIFMTKMRAQRQQYTKKGLYYSRRGRLTTSMTKMHVLLLIFNISPSFKRDNILQLVLSSEYAKSRLLGTVSYWPQAVDNSPLSLSSTRENPDSSSWSGSRSGVREYSGFRSGVPIWNRNPDSDRESRFWRWSRSKSRSGVWE